MLILMTGLALGYGINIKIDDWEDLTITRSVENEIECTNDASSGQYRIVLWLDPVVVKSNSTDELCCYLVFTVAEKYIEDLSEEDRLSGASILIDGDIRELEFIDEHYMDLMDWEVSWIGVEREVVWQYKIARVSPSLIQEVGNAQDVRIRLASVFFPRYGQLDHENISRIQSFYSSYVAGDSATPVNSQSSVFREVSAESCSEMIAEYMFIKLADIPQGFNN
jgi:hypothetical protein